MPRRHAAGIADVNVRKRQPAVTSRQLGTPVERRRIAAREHVGRSRKRFDQSVADTQAGQRKRAPRARHRDVEQPPRRIRVLACADPVPPAVEDDDVVELSPSARCAVSSMRPVWRRRASRPHSASQSMKCCTGSSPPPVSSGVVVRRSLSSDPTVPAAWREPARDRGGETSFGTARLRSQSSSACVSRSRQTGGTPRPPSVPGCHAARNGAYRLEALHGGRSPHSATSPSPSAPAGEPPSSAIRHGPDVAIAAARADLHAALPTGSTRCHRRPAAPCARARSTPIGCPALMRSAQAR